VSKINIENAFNDALIFHGLTGKIEVEEDRDRIKIYIDDYVIYDDGLSFSGDFEKCRYGRDHLDNDCGDCDGYECIYSHTAIDCDIIEESFNGVTFKEEIKGGTYVVWGDDCYCDEGFEGNVHVTIDCHGGALSHLNYNYVRENPLESMLLLLQFFKSINACDVVNTYLVHKYISDKVEQYF
jgi:hypothetical protein